MTLARALSLLLLLIGPGVSAHGDQTSSPIMLITVHMVTPRAGWGLTQHRLVRTQDGGLTWRAVPVSLPRVPTMLNVNVGFAVHGIDRVWLVPPAPYAGGQARSLVLSTVNGGRTWRRSKPIAGAAGSISWVTSRTGYILTYEGAAAGSVAHDLYRTDDGGRHWRLVEYNHLGSHSPSSLSACDGLSGISFRTVRAGWATGTCFAGPQILMLYVTDDGGRHWRRQSLPRPRGIRPGAWNLSSPAFFGRIGVLPVVMGSPASFGLYVTRDGGVTWSPTTPIRTHNPTVVPDAFVLTPALAWTWLDNTVYATQNGGGSWRRLAHLPFAGPPELDFLTPRTAFALGMVSNGRGPTWVLRRSIDGGRSWPTLRPVLAAARPVYG